MSFLFLAFDKPDIIDCLRDLIEVFHQHIRVLEKIDRKMFTVRQILRYSSFEHREKYGYVFIEHILKFHQSLRSADYRLGRQTSVFGDRNEAYVHMRCLFVHVNDC